MALECNLIVRFTSKQNNNKSIASKDEPLAKNDYEGSMSITFAEAFCLVVIFVEVYTGAFSLNDTEKFFSVADTAMELSKQTAGVATRINRTITPANAIDYDKDNPIGQVLETEVKTGWKEDQEKVKIIHER